MLKEIEFYFEFFFAVMAEKFTHFWEYFRGPRLFNIDVSLRCAFLDSRYDLPFL